MKILRKQNEKERRGRISYQGRYCHVYYPKREAGSFDKKRPGTLTLQGRPKLQTTPACYKSTVAPSTQGQDPI